MLYGIIALIVLVFASSFDSKASRKKSVGPLNDWPGNSKW